jgi:NTE family protein
VYTSRSELNRRSVFLGAGAALLGFSGCSLNPDYNYSDPEAPRQQLALRPAAAKPLRHVWVLSSGGPRGFVHVGILKALEELGHQPDMIVGGSVGALIGALYAGGVRAKELEQMSLELGVTDMGRLAVTGEGKFAGTPLASIVNRELIQRCGTCEIEKLPLPFAAVAVEKESRKTVLFNHGDAGVAVQASCAIEGIFTPVRIRGTQFVDADQVTPMPVRMARAWAQALNPANQPLKLLAMDATARPERAPPGMARYRESDLLKRRLIAPDAQDASLTLHPEMSYVVSVTKEFRMRTIEDGYRGTMAQAAQIKAALS